jgi:hypothetical protein
VVSTRVQQGTQAAFFFFFFFFDNDCFYSEMVMHKSKEKQ